MDKRKSKKLNLSAKDSNVNGTPPPLAKPIKVNNVKQAKKLLSRLIYQLQTEEIKSQKAKDITYLLSVFLTVIRDTELEERLTELERKVQSEGGKF